MDICSSFNSYELLSPLISSFHKNLASGKTNTSKKCQQPFLSQILIDELCKLLQRDGYSKFKNIRQQTHQLQLECFSRKENSQVLLTVWRTTELDNKMLCSKYEQLISAKIEGVLKYYDIICYPKLFFTVIVSECYEQTLQQELEKKSSSLLLQEDELNNFIIQTFYSLNLLHSMEVFHQCIDSSKIVITKEQKYKLSDFNFPLNIIQNHSSDSSLSFYANISINYSNIDYDNENPNLSRAIDIYQLIYLIFKLLQSLQQQLQKKLKKNPNLESKIKSYKQIQLYLQSHQDKDLNKNSVASSLKILNDLLPLLPLNQQDLQKISNIVQNVCLFEAAKTKILPSYEQSKRIELLKMKLFILKKNEEANKREMKKMYRVITSIYKQTKDYRSFLYYSIELLQHLFKHFPCKTERIISQLIIISQTYGVLEQHQKSLKFSVEALNLSLETYKENHYLIINSYIKASLSYYNLDQLKLSEDSINQAIAMYISLNQNSCKVHKNYLQNMLNMIRIYKNETPAH